MLLSQKAGNGDAFGRHIIIGRREENRCVEERVMESRHSACIFA